MGRRLYFTLSEEEEQKLWDMTEERVSERIKMTD